MSKHPSEREHFRDKDYALRQRDKKRFPLGSDILSLKMHQIDFQKECSSSLKFHAGGIAQHHWVKLRALSSPKAYSEAFFVKRRKGSGFFSEGMRPIKVSSTLIAFYAQIR